MFSSSDRIMSLYFHYDTCHHFIRQTKHVCQVYVHLTKNIGQSLITKLVVATLLNIFLLEMSFDKSTIGLHLLLISFMLAKFLEN